MHQDSFPIAIHLAGERSVGVGEVGKVQHLPGRDVSNRQRRPDVTEAGWFLTMDTDVRVRTGYGGTRDCCVRLELQQLLPQHLLGSLEILVQATRPQDAIVIRQTAGLRYGVKYAG